MFIDESINSVDEGFFLTDMTPGAGKWLNAPAARHNHGATFAFADGHAERWQWKGIFTELWGGSAVAQALDMKRVQDGVGR